MTINEIPKEKWEEMSLVREQSIKIGSSTEPADFETAEKCITDLYRRMGWNDEITFLHAKSPFHCQQILKEQFGSKKFVSTNFWGQMDVYWIAYIEFLASIDGMESNPEKMELLKVWSDISKSCSWWYVVNESTAIICDRPEEVHWNDQAMLHAENGMSIKYRDGWGIYTYNGVSLDETKSWIITNPEKITLKSIKDEHNVEIRRIMQEIYGIPRYLDESGAKIIDMDSVKIRENSDEYMPRALMEDEQGDRYLVGTDGSTKKVFYMSVDPESETCIEAHNSISPVNESIIEGNS